MSERITWDKQNTGVGWNRYEGYSKNFGPYIIEKEDVRSFSIWWGHFEIGESSDVASAKKIAQQHCNSLSPSPMGADSND